MNELSIESSINLIKDLMEGYIKLIDKDINKINGTWAEEYYKKEYIKYKDICINFINSEHKFKQNIIEKGESNIISLYNDEVYLQKLYNKDYEIGNYGDVLNNRINYIALSIDLLTGMFENKSE